MDDKKEFSKETHDSIGDKIQGLARFLFWAEIIGSIIIAIVMLYNATTAYNENREWDIFLAVLCIIGGIVVATFSSWILYGFGELIEKVSSIETYLYNQKDTFIADCDEEKTNYCKRKKFKCPTCEGEVSYGAPCCEKCGEEFDWSNS